MLIRLYYESSCIDSANDKNNNNLLRIEWHEKKTLSPRAVITIKKDFITI